MSVCVKCTLEKLNRWPDMQWSTGWFQLQFVLLLFKWQPIITNKRPSLPKQLEMWANAQPDGRPAEYRWRPLLNAAVWLTPTTRVPCSNAAKTRNPLKFAGVPQTNETISAASGPKVTILWGHLEEILLLKGDMQRFFTKLMKSSF